MRLSSAESCERALRALQNGDESAMSDIYDHMSRLVFSVTYAITSNYNDAEDALQNTMTDVSRCVGEYRGGSAKAWILKIAKNRAIDIVRKRKSDVSLDSGDVADIGSHDPEFSRIEVIEMLSILNDDEKSIVVFRVYAKLPYISIAKIMDMSVASAQKKYQRAIKKLKNNYLGGNSHEKA